MFSICNGLEVIDMSIRTVSLLKETINDYLQRNYIHYEDAPWEIKESPLGGFGVFARRDIDVGEIIFFDCPVILGPRCAQDSPTICVNCFNRHDIRECGNNCGLPVCSKVCQNSLTHQRECKFLRQIIRGEIDESSSHKLLKCLTPIRSLLLSEEDKEVVRILKAHKGKYHGYEVNVMTNELMFEIKDDDNAFLRFVCGVLDANAFEVIIGNEDNQSSLRGLYPLASLANHRCFPNTMHVFDDKRRMIVRASTLILKGNEIFHSYSRIIWATITRIYHLLKTKHFLCKCERCRDPTEFQTYMSSILCSNCKGKVISLNPLKVDSQWECQDCKKLVTGVQVGELMSLLGSVLKGCDNDDIPRILKFLNNRLLSLVPENSQVIVEVKYKTVLILGHKKGFTWKELSVELLYVKKKFCDDLLILLEKLRTGQCKMRGLLLYELYECVEELKSRGQKISDVNNEDSQSYLTEAANILMYDVSAPELIKQRWQFCSKK